MGAQSFDVLDKPTSDIERSLIKQRNEVEVQKAFRSLMVTLSATVKREGLIFIAPVQIYTPDKVVTGQLGYEIQTLVDQHSDKGPYIHARLSILDKGAAVKGDPIPKNLISLRSGEVAALDLFLEDMFEESPTVKGKAHVATAESYQQLGLSKALMMNCREPLFKDLVKRFPQAQKKQKLHIIIQDRSDGPSLFQWTRQIVEAINQRLRERGEDEYREVRTDVFLKTFKL